MRISDLISLANEDGLAGPDLDLKRRLLHVELPTYLLDIDQRCGKTFWRLRDFTLSPVANDRELTLPSDFGRMDRIIVSSSNYRGHEFRHLADDSTDHLLWETITTPGLPTHYRIKYASSAYSIRFSQLFDTACTLVGQYYADLNYLPDTPVGDGEDVDEDVDLGVLVPAKFQVPLVHRLRAYIYENRFGIGDGRYTSTMKLYDGLLDSYRVTHRSASTHQRSNVYMR